MTEGDEPDSVFYIVSGTVKIFKGKKNRKQVGILNPGGSFGDYGVVNGKPRSASCVTDEPVEMLKIHAQNFKTIVDQALLHRLSEEHDSTTADFMALRGQPDRARAHELLEELQQEMSSKSPRGGKSPRGEGCNAFQVRPKPAPCRTLTVHVAI